MTGTPPNPQLLRSLGKLVRGLSALFWGLPAALLAGATAAQVEWLKPLGFLPLLAVNGMLCYGLSQLGDFQPQERPWRATLDRARLLGWVNLGLCPFIYWHHRAPAEPCFAVECVLGECAAALLLYQLNTVLQRLGAMLPDETLRQETRQFTVLNKWLLTGLLAAVAIAGAGLEAVHVGKLSGRHLDGLVQAGEAGAMLLLLVPLTMTMALLWKTKEVILDGVFGPR